MAVLALLIGAAGCGHSVTPTGDFRDPGSVPRPLDPDARAINTGVLVSWFADAGVFAIIDGWYVYRAPAPDGAFVRLTPAPLVEQSFFDAEVSGGATYRYRVTAVTPAGLESFPTDPVTVTVDFVPPAPPTGIAAAAEPNPVTGAPQVRVWWNASPEPDFDHYNLFRDPPVPGLPVVTDLHDPGYVDIEVEPGAAYRYWVTAWDRSANASAAADTALVTVPRP